MLKCSNLNVQIEDKVILNNFNIDIKKGETHAIMGPNGIGKSTICKTIMGYPDYKVINGRIIYKNKDLLEMNISERAKEGIYLINQNPIAIEGVTNAEMLRMALSEKTGSYVNLFEFNQKLEEICDKLSIPKDFIHRDINGGMSGGERKKNEMLHLWMLLPEFILLDELDSGLDVDSLNLVIESINEYKEEYNPSILIITHHAKLLKSLKVDYVHILIDGKIIETGSLDLALETDKTGFKKYYQANNVSEIANNE